MQEIVYLNRLVTWTQYGIEMEADPRHARLIIEHVPVSGTVGNPCVKESSHATDDPHAERSLSPEDVTPYRSTAMRVAYLSQDRPDLQIAARYLAQGLKDPKERHWTALKRVAKYLRGNLRLVQLFPFHDQTVTRYEGWCDSNHAGCVRTRKSTTGYVGMIGPCCVRTRVIGQGLISLSSGESEYYGLVSGMSQGLGDQSIAKDWNVFLELQIWQDASTSIAIGNRKGLGKVKHIDTSFLWCQDVISQRRALLGKKNTKEMLADMFTKPVSGQAILDHLGNMNYRFEQGDHKLALDST